MSEAKIELLIRRSGDSAGFRIKEVTSGEVYAGYRPKRIADEGFESVEEVSPVDGRRYFVLKAANSEKYLYLNEREHFLWEMMDGTRSIRDIATEYFFNFGSLDFSSIRFLLTRLRESGLVVFVPSSRLRVSIDSSSNPLLRLLKKWLSKADYRVGDADAWVSRLYKAGGRIFVSRTMMALYVILSVLGVVSFGHVESVGRFPYRLFFEHPVLVIAVAVISFFPIAAVHELFHALACKRFGRKVYAFGFTLWDGFYPAFYTDVSDIYLSNRRERLYVSLAGPISTTAIAALFLVPVAISHSASWAETFYEIGRLNLIVAFISLYPFQFLKMDGYYLLVDFLGFPGLRERSLSFVRSIPDFVRSGKPFTRRELIMAVYFLLSLGSLIMFFMYFFWVQ